MVIAYYRFLATLCKITAKSIYMPNAQCPMPNAQCPMPNAPYNDE
ncbi:hypothetical protein [[Scytonema hofmanni] UTEX B 1581]|nr:hypothetical protein [[Scytonema hofmanni] UTEX B 1581]